MSYMMIHLGVAGKYVKQHPDKYSESVLPYFYAGSVAPDCVHVRDNYEPSMKEKSHLLPTDVRWGTVHTVSEMERLYRNIRLVDKANREGFHRKLQLAEYTKLEDKALAFYEGYILHMLTDIFNIQKVYAPVFNAAGLEVWEFMKGYRQQCIIQDNWTYNNLPESKQIWEKLMKLESEEDNLWKVIEALGFDKVITGDEVLTQIRFFDKEYRNAPFVDISECRIHTAKSTFDFMDYVAEKSNEVLFEFPDIPGLFDM